MALDDELRIYEWWGDKYPEHSVFNDGDVIMGIRELALAFCHGFVIYIDIYFIISTYFMHTHTINSFWFSTKPNISSYININKD